ncbi:MFS transporter (plasmid) [Tistrella bauzanensis]|uniref:MFS transporter n=2 Tax=Tistrella TaxID=171436 RepID=UPI003557D762
MRRGPMVIALVFLPFMTAYLLSEMFRNVNGVVGRILRAELGIGPEQLGLLTAVFLAAIAGSQIFVGVALDRYGPRRVVGGLMLIAAAGAVLFAADDFGRMVAGRFLIGLGMAACWAAAFKANATWFRPERLALANSATLGLAGLGALAATLPTELIIARTHWHNVFLGLAVVAVVLAAVIWLVVPEPGQETAPDATDHASIGDAFRGLLAIATSRVFWKIGPVSFLAQGVWLAYQGLWAGAWMADVDRLAPVPAATTLMWLAMAIVAGQLGFGLIADRLQRRGISLWTTMAVTTTGFVVVQAMLLVAPSPGVSRALWIAYGLFTAGPIFTYALLSLALPPALSGRAISLLNLFATLAGFVLQYGVGVIIEGWAPLADGHYPTDAHRTALGVMVAMQGVALVWMLWPGWRPQPAARRPQPVARRR